MINILKRFAVNLRIRLDSKCRNFSYVREQNTQFVKGRLADISDYAPPAAPLVPNIIVCCVNEIENRGMNYRALYGISGSKRNIKILKKLLLKAKQSPLHLGKFDIYDVCGCIKDFLRLLKEPLIPTNYWHNFSNAVENPCEKNIEVALKKAIELLPQVNRDTLAYLVLHFQRIAECREIQMPLVNMVIVFAPTIVGYTTCDLDAQTFFKEAPTQYEVMSRLLKLPAAYWSQVMNLTNKENQICEDFSCVIEDTNRELRKRNYFSCFKKLKSRKNRYSKLNNEPA